MDNRGRDPFNLLFAGEPYPVRSFWKGDIAAFFANLYRIIWLYCGIHHCLSYKSKGFSAPGSRSSHGFYNLRNNE